MSEQQTETVDSLANRIKAKYPVYADVPNAELVRRVIDKYPQYQTRLATSELQKLASGNPSMPSEGVSIFGGGGPLAPDESLTHAVIRQSLGGVGRAVENIVGLPYQTAKAAFEPPQTPGDVAANVGGPPVLAAKRMLVDPLQAEAKTAQKEMDTGHPVYGTAHAVLSALPVVGPLVGSLLSEAQAGDVGAIPEALTYAVAPEVAKPIVRRLSPEAMEANRRTKAQGQFENALATPPGKGGARALAMQRDIQIATPDLEKISKEIQIPGRLQRAFRKFRDTNSPQSFFDLADAIDQRQQAIWQGEHEPLIKAHPDVPVDPQALIDAGKAQITQAARTVDRTGAIRASRWLDGLKGVKTISELDDVVRELNGHLRSKGMVERYGELNARVKSAVLQAARDEIESTLLDLNEPSIKAINQRYGALGNIKGRLLERGQQIAVRTGQRGILPDWAHAYAFVHPGGAALGLGVSGIRFLRPTGEGQLTGALDKFSRTASEIPKAERLRLIRQAGLLPRGPLITPPPADTSFVRGVPAMTEAPEAIRFGRLLPQGEQIGPIVPPYRGEPAGSEPTPTGGARGYSTEPQPEAIPSRVYKGRAKRLRKAKRGR